MYHASESELSAGRQTESWTGIPGTGTYKHTERVRGDRWKQFFLTREGLQLTTLEFDWTRDFSKVIATLEKGSEDKIIAEESAAAKARGEDLTPIKRAEITRTALAETKKEIGQDVALFNVFKENQERLSVVTGQLPKALENIAGVKGAKRTFLVEEGSRAENNQRIFEQLRGLNRVKVDDIFHSNDVTPSHIDHDFFGWKVEVGGIKFVFILNSAEEDAPEEKATIH